jgi:hypothetical protein
VFPELDKVVEANEMFFVKFPATITSLLLSIAILESEAPDVTSPP